MSGQHASIPIPGAVERRRAFALALLMICGCVLTLPLAGTYIPQFIAFNLIANTALAMLYLLVAGLLFTQFMAVRSLPRLALACGFLLAAFTTLPQLLRMAQGAFVDPRLYFVADLAVPLAVFAGTWLRRAGYKIHLSGVSLLIRAVTATVVIAALTAWLAASGPLAFRSDVANAPWHAFAATLLAAANLAAILLVWRRRASRLDRWLLVAMTAWLIAVLLEALAPHGASFAWQLAQLYGIFGAACLTVALLAENAGLGARRAGSDAIGQGMLQTLADEISQPLCAITANADAIARLLEARAPDLPEIRAALADISGQALRVNDTMRAAQQLGEGAGEPPSVVDVGQLVADCLGGLRSELHVQRVTCEVETAAQLPAIRGFRRQLLQLLTNLVTNSLQAMSGAQPGERRLMVRASRHDARAVAIWVEHSGAGVRPETHGLAACHSIVVAHGGHISVTPGAAGGASFRIVLPAGS